MTSIKLQRCKCPSVPQKRISICPRPDTDSNRASVGLILEGSENELCLNNTALRRNLWAQQKLVG